MHSRRWLVLLAFVVSTPALAQLPDFTRLVEDQGAAVVNISTTQAARRTGGAVPQVPGIEDEEVLEFFRRFIPRPGPGPRERVARRRRIDDARPETLQFAQVRLFVVNSQPAGC